MKVSPQLQGLDEKILLFTQRMRSRPLTWVLTVFTWTGAGKFWVVTSVLMNIANYFYMMFNPYFLKGLFAPLIVWGVNTVLKRKLKRDRPWVTNKEITPLIKTPACFSFPSSHAGSTFAYFFILLFWEFPEAKWFGIWAGIVSFSRLYLGVHYLSDILAGIGIGLLAAFMVSLLG